MMTLEVATELMKLWLMIHDIDFTIGEFEDTADGVQFLIDDPEEPNSINGFYAMVHPDGSIQTQPSPFFADA